MNSLRSIGLRKVSAWSQNTTFSPGAFYKNLRNIRAQRYYTGNMFGPMIFSPEDSARFSEELSDDMRCIFTQISRLAVAPALEAGHDCSGGFNNQELVTLATMVDISNKRSKLGLRELNEDLVFSHYDKNKVPKIFTMLANGHSSLKIDDWKGFVISTCTNDEDMFVFVGYLDHVIDFCSRINIHRNSLGIIGIKLGNSIMAPVHTNNPKLEHDAFVFVG